MRTLVKRFIAGLGITLLASAMNACSPVYTAPERAQAVVVNPEPVYEPAPAPVQTVEVQPVVPVWAPPYQYVTEVHYYYFPDYMVYYDVFSSNYVYYNGFSWVMVTSLPGLPIYAGFNPYNSYIVVLDRYCDHPWYRHDYYQAQYPRDYYNHAYAPRQSLGSNTVLRAYDENQRRPLFVNRQTNREVAVKYDVVNAPRGSVNSVPVRNNPVVQSGGSSKNSVVQTPRTAGNLINQPVRTSLDVRSNPVAQTPRNTGVVQNSRGDANTSATVGRNNPSPMPRNDTYSNSNVSRNQYQSIPRHDDVAPTRNVMPVRSQPEIRTGQQAMPSNRQPVMARQYTGNSDSRAAVNSGRKEVQVVPQQSVRQAKAERSR